MRPGLRRAAWYGLCIILGGGCLYTEPVWRMNEPPTLILPDIEPGELYVVDLYIDNFMFVVVNDPDTKEISCAWDIPWSDAQEPRCIPEADGNFQTTLAVPQDPELDGEIVEAHLFDGLSQTEITVKFLLSAGQEI